MQVVPRNLLGLLVVLAAGGLHFGLVFADLSPVETKAIRLLEFPVVGLVAGTALGFLLERKFLPYCVAGSWGAVLAGAMLLAMGDGENLWVYVSGASAAAIVLGGVIGRLLQRFGPFQRRASR